MIEVFYNETEWIHEIKCTETQQLLSVTDNHLYDTGIDKLLSVSSITDVPNTPV